MKKILIKQLSKREFFSAYKFQEKILNPKHKKKIRNFNYSKRHYAKNPYFFLGAYSQEELIGVIFGYVIRKELLIGEFAVSKEYRNKNVGTQLLQSIERIAKTNEIKKIVLGAKKGIEAFYIRMEYQPTLFVQTNYNFLNSILKKYEVLKKRKGKFWIKLEYNPSYLNKAKKEFKAYNVIYVFEKEI